MQHLLRLTGVVLLFTLFLAPTAHADRDGNNACPVGLVNGMDLDTEFGPGTAALTKCLKRRHNVKLVLQINQFCMGTVTNGVCTTNRAYALGNIENIIDDYEITHGMKPGRDYEITAIVHGPGGQMLVKNEVLVAKNRGTNPFENQVKALMARGVKFYFCQNTTRAYIANGMLDAGLATSQMVEGAEYTTAGLTSLADFQSRGWQYVQP